MGIEGDVPPHDGAALLGQFPRKGAVDTDEPIPNELLYLRVAERARAPIVSHEISLYSQTVRRQLRNAETAGLRRFTAKNSLAAETLPPLWRSRLALRRYLDSYPWLWIRVGDRFDGNRILTTVTKIRINYHQLGVDGQSLTGTTEAVILDPTGRC